MLPSSLKRLGVLPLLGLALAGLGLLSMTLGHVPITLGEAVAWLGQRCLHRGGLSPERESLVGGVLLRIRLPRILAASLIGASLSVSGTAYQAMFVNPLVSPGLLGVLAGASFGAALGMITFSSWALVQGSAFLFGFLAVAAAMAIARVQKGDRLLLLVLGGVISGALFTSLLSVVKAMADPYNQLPALVQWLMGSLAAVDLRSVALYGAPQGICILAITALGGYLNALSLGDEEARSLGVPVERMRGIVILLTTLMCSLTVVMAGMIGWVGLVIPHLSRMLVGPDNRILVPASALLGALYLLAVDGLSRTLFQVEIPIGISTAILGIPFFVLALRKARTGWS